MLANRSITIALRWEKAGVEDPARWTHNPLKPASRILLALHDGLHSSQLLELAALTAVLTWRAGPFEDGQLENDGFPCLDPSGADCLSTMPSALRRHTSFTRASRGARTAGGRYESRVGSVISILTVFALADFPDWLTSSFSVAAAAKMAFAGLRCDKRGRLSSLCHWTRRLTTTPLCRMAASSPDVFHADGTVSTRSNASQEYCPRPGLPRDLPRSSMCRTGS